MYRSDGKTEKWPVEIEVTLDDGTSMLGFLFITPMRRVSEMLNDERQFLPFRQANGRIVLLRKVAINKISELDQNIDLDKVLDPYEVLGVPRDISDADMKETFKNLCLLNHSDRMMSLNMAPEIISFADARIARIIDAYRQITKKRNIGSTESESAEGGR